MISSIQSSIIFVIVAGLIFSSVGLIYRRLSNWRSLSALYPERKSPRQISNGSYRWVRCTVNLVSFSTSIEIYPSGLAIRPGFPLSFFMPPALLPWKMIIGARYKRGFWGQAIEFCLTEFSGKCVIKGHAASAVNEIVNGVHTDLGG